MRIIEPKVELINPRDYEDLLSVVEIAGRTCYKSESKITDGSAENFIGNVIKRGHESVLEHASVTVRFTCDRGVTHEIVRHRIAAYSQASTRYCNYSKDQFGGEITVIKPLFFADGSEAMQTWEKACESCETAYFKLLDCGCSPEEARSVLPNSLMTELVMTADMREWRHFLKLRISKAAHPQIREVSRMLLKEFKEHYPIFFTDISEGGKN